MKGLQLRFTTIGGSEASVRAAYVSLGVKGQAARILRPNGDVSGFTSVPGGSAADALDDRVTQPDPVSAKDYLNATTADTTTTVTLGSVDVAGGKITSGRAWFYGATGKGTKLRVEVVSGGIVRASTTVAANRGNAWRSVKFKTLTQPEVNTLQLRFSAVGGTKTKIRASYATVTAAANADSDAVNAYLTSLNTITAGPEEAPHPVGDKKPTDDAILPDPTAPSGRSRYQCTRTPYSMATAPDKIVALNPDSNKLWLGGLLQGQGYADGLGSLRELPIRKRAPLTIYTDLLGPQVSTTITNPDAASVQQGISDLVNKAIAANVPVPLRASYLQTDEQSSSQALLKLGFSAKYMGVSASAKLESNRTAQESTVMASFVQRMFTVSIVTPSTPAAYFSRDFTKADLDAQKAEGRISENNPPVVVGSISYGRTLLYSVTSAASTSELSGALNAAYGGGAASAEINLDGRQQEILNRARYQVVALGGQESDAMSLIKTHKLGDYFTSQSNPATAVPISYQVNNIGNDSAARFTETTNYNLTECTRVDNTQKKVGSRVRLNKPMVYMDGNRGSADIYGNLMINGDTQWSRSRGGHQTIHLHNQTELDGWRQPSTDAPPWQLDLRDDQAPRMTVTGSINCKLYFPEFGADPSNQYNWQWNLSDGGYGDVEIPGGSRSCPITLRTQMVKIADLYEYEP